MNLEILALRAEHVQLPLFNPFVLSIRSATHANIVRWSLSVTGASGIRQYPGECVPVQYVTSETVDTVLELAPQLETTLQGKDIRELYRLIEELEERYPHAIAARAGVEIALYHAYADLHRTSIHQLLGGKGVVLTTDLTIAKVPNAVEIASRAYEQGFRIFKMKVGGEDVDADYARVLAVHKALENVVIRLDANQAFHPTEAVAFTSRLLDAGVNIEMIEQPVAKENIRALDETSQRSPVPVIADEACKSAADAEMLFTSTAVHGVNIKLMKSGIQGALEIIRCAQHHGKQLMIGCMLESEVGIAAAVALAAGTGAFDYVDLDGHLLVKLPATPTMFHAEGPHLRVA